jgi:superoxide dismutase
MDITISIFLGWKTIVEYNPNALEIFNKITEGNEIKFSTLPILKFLHQNHQYLIQGGFYNSSQIKVII